MMESNWDDKKIKKMEREIQKRQVKTGYTNKNVRTVAEEVRYFNGIDLTDTMRPDTRKNKNKVRNHGDKMRTKVQNQ